MNDLFSPQQPHLALPPEQALEALQLIRSEQVGARTFHALVRRFGSPRKAVAALPDLAQRSGRKKLVLCAQEKAAAELAQAQHFGAHILLYGTAAYPALLAQLPDAPPIVFALGNLSLLQKPQWLAVVGARNASAQGYAFARQLAREAAQAGFGIVSGLARGIDAAAHSGALEAQGATVGVIAGGIDTWQALPSLLGVCALLGHIYPVWLRFKGGKGVATFLGILCKLSPALALAFGITWLGVFKSSRISSLSALTGAATVFLAACAIVALQMARADQQDALTMALVLPHLACIGMACGLIFYTHRANILRLKNGTEPRFGSPKASSAPSESAETAA